LAVCQKREDEWGNIVQAHVHDLPAADEVYHITCCTNFRNMKQIPASYDDEDSSLKRAKLQKRKEWLPLRSHQIHRKNGCFFLEVTKFLKENDDE